MMIRIFLGLLFSLSLSGSLLFLVWWLLQFLTKNKFTRRFYYYLLLIVLLRFIVPFSPNQSLIGVVFRRLETVPLYHVFANNPSGNAVNTNTSIGKVVAETNLFTTVELYLFAIWLFVAFFLIVQKITKYQSFVKYVKAGWKPVDDPAILNLVGNICEEKNIKSVVDVYTTSLVSSPLLLGMRKSYIVLPYEELTEGQLYCILSHELTHYKSRDLYYKWLMQLIASIHWFNPLIYYIQRVMNQECEYACDEAAINKMDKESRYEYGLTLIEMTKHPGKYKERVASVTLYENANEIKERLNAILHFSKLRKAGKPLSYSITTGLVALSFITGAYYAQPIKAETGEQPSKEVPEETVDTTTNDSESIHIPVITDTEDSVPESEPESETEMHSEEPPADRPLGRRFS